MASVTVAEYGSAMSGAHRRCNCHRLSDFADGTLISPESPVYEQVSRLAIGTTVVFSGSFLSSEMDYVEEASVTEEGSMMEPELIFRFEAIRPWTPEHAN